MTAVYTYYMLQKYKAIVTGIQYHMTFIYTDKNHIKIIHKQ